LNHDGYTALTWPDAGNHRGIYQNIAKECGRTGV
jgi:hypothetical protein